MKLPEPITIGGKKGLVSFFDQNLKQVPKKQATMAKVHFEPQVDPQAYALEDGRIAFFYIEPRPQPKRPKQSKVAQMKAGAR